jgi:CHAT domain-containing protein/Flp pilus assembly protein TadD
MDSRYCCIVSLHLLGFTAGLLPLFGIPHTVAQVPVKATVEPVAVQNQDTKTEQLQQQGIQQFRRSQLRDALKTFEQVLAIRRKLKDRAGESETLTTLGQVYNDLSQYPQAVESLQQALMIRKALGDRQGEGETLTHLGEVYTNLSQDDQALDVLQQALNIHQTVGNRAGEGETLFKLGQVYNALSQYDKALELLQQSLLIRDEVGDTFGKGRTLQTMGSVYRKLGEYERTLELYQQALLIVQKIGDRLGESRVLAGIGIVYDSQGKYSQALEFLQQALVIRQDIGNRAGEAGTLNTIGLVYDHLGQYERSLDHYQQALAIAKEIGEPSSEGNILSNIAGIYYSQAQYPQALDFYQQALAVLKPLDDKAGEGRILSNIGLVYSNLGQNQQSLDFYQQALKIRRAIGEKPGEAYTLHNMGIAYDQLEQYPSALKALQRALGIRQTIGDKPGEGATLNSLGLVYEHQGQYERSVQLYQQALALFSQLGNRPGEGRTLNSLGVAYYHLEDYSQALEKLQQALGILKELGDKAGESITLGNIAYLHQIQNQPELAIVFYKQSVNLTETIRKDLQVLPPEQQESYTTTIADTYRSLADLLLKQNRVLEAQQVLDLLKVQELQDYLRKVRGNEQTVQGVELLPQEEKVAANYSAIQDKAINLGKELTALRKIPEANRTPTQTKRIAELVKAQEAITADFNQFSRSREVIALNAERSQLTQNQTLSLRRLRNIQDNLQKLGQGAVLLYPLILEDRLELILTTPYSPPIRRTVAVKREELNRVILEFRAALTKPSTNAEIPAQQLYTWLIKPIENDLAQAEAKTLIYAPDGQLRYIPLAALYDGKQWLVQRFRINHITADSLTDFNTQPSTQPRVLAAGFTEGNYSFQIGQRNFSFAGLPFAAREIENLVKIIPNSTELLDQNFTREATIPRLNDYNIIHLATHAAFLVGQPDDSFILLGNGDRVTLNEVENWQLTNVDLIVLSACQTGLGGKLGNGEEILGFGYLMQEAGARAAIATLWAVDDGGTQALMDAFYKILAKGNITKTEALRQAQMALITGDSTVADSFSDPYYWAPFILIGNGL